MNAMTRNEIADKATQEIMSFFYPTTNFGEWSGMSVVKAIILSALLEMSNDELERNLESTRKQLAMMRGKVE
jgi:hypothetical protein